MINIGNNNLLETNKIWALADKGDFNAILESLSTSGTADKDLGQVLFSLAGQAVEEKKHNTAIDILIFISQSLENKADAFSLLKKNRRYIHTSFRL